MVAKTNRATFALITILQITMAAAIISVAGAGTASAYIGESFLSIPGISTAQHGGKYKDWVTVQANYWADGSYGSSGTSKPSLFYRGPIAPHEGANALVISIDKHNPALPALMDTCLKKAHIAELTYAENSQRARSTGELGPRPEGMPEFFEYKLTDVRLSDCPVVSGAPEQAFVVSFNDIRWLNYQGGKEGMETKLAPASLPPLNSSGTTRAFVVTWFAAANDVTDDQCPVMNAKPSEEDYYALMSKEKATEERAKLAGKGGVSYDDEQMAHRGPKQLNVCQLPGIVADPGHVLPQTKLARGLNLDGDDGTGAPPAGTCKHRNYVSADGRTGIDNQLFTVLGCATGFMGHKGFTMQFTNSIRRNGYLSILLVISGIDDERNDDNVDVTVLYSKDGLVKNATGTDILPNYTFRLTDKVEYTHYFTRLHGRILNGVLVTEPVDQLQFNLVVEPELRLHHAGLRLEFMPDGSLKGVAAGYQDWREIMGHHNTSRIEFHGGFQCPGMYNAFKRMADGLKDPVTGECNGISAAYDIEAVPAFITPGQQRALMVRADARGQ